MKTMVNVRNTANICNYVNEAEFHLKLHNVRGSAAGLENDRYFCL